MNRTLLKIIKKIVPKKFYFYLLEIYFFLRHFKYLGKGFKCSFCQKSFKTFLTSGIDVPVLKLKKVIGGELNKNCLCPKCNSSDRERLIHVFIKKNKHLEKIKNKKILHIAPEKNLLKFFKHQNPKEYIDADLNKIRATHEMNLTNIIFKDNYFDIIICNHVLEHIENDGKAIKELYRVLKPNGWAILQVPISENLKNTFENNKIKSKKERLKFFGQSDHVRIYAKDYKKRLTQKGFKVNLKKLSKREINKYNLNKKEYIYFCKK
ncbi:methyltransferase domain-containing protein [Candidatus Woesearchaeota archaeon]|jgi:predicted SAM-dependent methyltransferase|nr:methyltransferase domain-containing protein [Candidatus Woesearchaeota archaeon]MBT4387375.1 methyltransferase domain-containing protein [Candidatus Woesearchaeota archaeon]MBT4595513.1 methyltransferase domain-containing protein [Candidatus Woesearchaeota archaeon]MBT5741005.1 methyltransferase domain-containing protein [Candidatus Woesearchaeota archaeon]MBT6506012.1 methyltransferase domain-containing protein [Candidatus Woesearchaeota archaeon]